MYLLLSSLVWIFGVPAIGACLYLLVLTVLSSELPLLPPSRGQLRFDVIVPAHNEESVIAEAVASLKRVDWPQDRFRVVVVADNCTDATAAIASSAGAHVMQRQDF